MKLIITESQEQQITFDALVEKRDLKGIAKFLQTRIPFLKDGYNVFFDQRPSYRSAKIQFQRQFPVNDKVEMIDGEMVEITDGMFTNNFNFYIFLQGTDEKLICSFQVEPFLYTKLNTDNQLLVRIYNMAQTQMIEKTYGLYMEYPEKQLDTIINEINKRFFMLEDMLKKGYKTQM